MSEEIIKRVIIYLKDSVRLSRLFLGEGEGIIPLKNLYAHDKKLIALLEGKTWKEANIIEQDSQKEEFK